MSEDTLVGLVLILVVFNLSGLVAVLGSLTRIAKAIEKLDH